MKIVHEKKGRGKAISSLYTIWHNRKMVGILEKFLDTRLDKHPWKAFAVKPGTEGRSSKYPEYEFLGAFYPEDGGKEAAINAIKEKLY